MAVQLRAIQLAQRQSGFHQNLCPAPALRTVAFELAVPDGKCLAPFLRQGRSIPDDRLQENSVEASRELSQNAEREGEDRVYDGTGARERR